MDSKKHQWNELDVVALAVDYKGIKRGRSGTIVCVLKEGEMYMVEFPTGGGGGKLVDLAFSQLMPVSTAV